MNKETKYKVGDNIITTVEHVIINYIKKCRLVKYIKSGIILHFILLLLLLIVSFVLLSKINKITK